ncbi:MAG: hypothetical protein U0Y10_16520 [Spirosomataceae bacterium]
MNHTSVSNTLILILICLTAAWAQPTIEQGRTGSTTAIRFYNMAQGKYDVLSGNPYLFEEFADGEVLTNTGRWVDGMKLRYNSYSHQVEYKSLEQIMTAAPKDVRAFKIGNMLMKSGFPPIEKQNEFSYYEVVYSGKSTLLRHHTTEMVAEKGFDDVKQGDKFVTYVFYYWLTPEHKMNRVLLSKKSIIGVVLPDKESKIEAFINEKKLKLKTAEDLLEVIKYHDSL